MWAEKREMAYQVSYMNNMWFNNSAVPPEDNRGFYSFFIYYLITTRRGNEVVDDGYIPERFLEHFRRYTEFVFVHSEAEAAGFPDHVLVAWPSEITPGVIPGFHWAVPRDESELIAAQGQRRREVVSFEDFGLSYPLTVADLVDNWEQVMALWQSLTDTEQTMISGAAPDGGVRAAAESVAAGE